LFLSTPAIYAPKTELWATLASLIGNDFVYAGPLYQLEKSRFTIGFLRGKFLFVDDDIVVRPVTRRV